MSEVTIRDLRPLTERQAEFYAAELRECIAFAVVAIVGLYGLLSMGGM